jgi:hypothetical protein
MCRRNIIIMRRNIKSMPLYCIQKYFGAAYIRAGVKQVHALVQKLQQMAKNAGHERPLMIGTDQENGLTLPSHPRPIARLTTGESQALYLLLVATKLAPNCPCEATNVVLKLSYADESVALTVLERWHLPLLARRTSQSA